MEGMPRKLPLHVTRERTRHGKVKFYFRRYKGQRIRLPDDPASKEFDEAYVSALAGRPLLPPESPKEASKSLRWLIERYKESNAWEKLSGSTRTDRDAIFLTVIANTKNAPYTDITRASVLAGMDSRRKTPAAANNFLKAIRSLFEWAKLNEHITQDPTEGIKYNKLETDGFKPWTIEDYLQYQAKHPIGTVARLAIELLLHSGLRRSDIVLAGKQHLRGNVFTMKTKKTNAVITVEFPQSLLDIIKATETSDLHFLSWGTTKRRPYTAKGFQAWFRKQCDDAHLDPELSAHGVRKLSATLAANGGAPAHELMAQYGWTNLKQAEIYTKGADRKKLGISSSRRIVDQIENASPRTDNQVRETEEKG